MFYEKLGKEELEMIKNISKLTMTNYEITGDFIPVDSWKNLAEDLLYEFDKLQEEFEDYKEFVKDNYKQKTNEEIYGFID